MVEEEPPEFTDYLNFFEFIGCLHEMKQLNDRDITALFDYYLKLLKRNKDVRGYINNPDKGYEKLKRLIDKTSA